MPVVCQEHFESRKVSTGRDNVVELRYIVSGTNDAQEAHAAVVATSPTVYDPFGGDTFVLPRSSISISPLGDKLWEAIVRYEVFSKTLDSAVTFDTSGGTQRIIYNLQTVQAVAAPGRIPPPTHNLIGNTGDSVEGVDITVPVYNFSETHYKPNDQVTLAYRGAIFSLTGSVNNAPFKGLAAGECLFLGAAGSRRGEFGDWEITYRFAAMPNVSNLSIGPISGINKEGWDYVTVLFEDEVDATSKVLVKKPLAAYVHRVYPRKNFALLNIGT